MIPSFEANNAKAYVNGTEIISGQTVLDFTNPVTMYVTNGKVQKAYTIVVNTTGLPVFVIQTPEQKEIQSKEEWLKYCDVCLVDTNGVIFYQNDSLQIKGRGNSTWEYPKQSYSIKLLKRFDLIGGGAKHKRWVLLANYLDRTLLRNDVALYATRQTDMDWIPSGEFVELVLNNKHLGNYYLCEQIRVDNNRVNIKEMTVDDVAGENVTGGYLVELDNNFDEINKFKSSIRQLPYMFKNPDEDVLQPEQFKYFQDYVNAFETALYKDDWLESGDFRDYIDYSSFADFWIVYELAKSHEPRNLEAATCIKTGTES